MLKHLAMVSVLLTLLGAAFHWQGQTPKTPSAEYKIPPEAASQTNPVKTTPESLARGKKIYGYDCAVRHGKNGDGKGDMSDMKGIPDFTDPTVQKAAPTASGSTLSRRAKEKCLPRVIAPIPKTPGIS
jgi:hypothetical protein